jgi:putative peptidoglycan lipid II flippase
MGVTGLAIGVVAGAFGLLAIQLPPLWRAGYRFSPKIDLSDDKARRMLTLMGPRVLGLSATQITFVVMTSLATGVGVGAVSAFTLAYAVLQIPMGVIGVPLGIVIFPSLSRQLAIGETEGYLELVARSLRILIFVHHVLLTVSLFISRTVLPASDTNPASTQSARSTSLAAPAGLATRLINRLPFGKTTSNRHGSCDTHITGLCAASRPSMKTLNCTLAWRARKRPWSVRR